MSRKLRILLVGVAGIVGAGYLGSALGRAGSEEWRNMTPQQRQAELAQIEQEQAARNLADHPDGGHCLAFGGEHGELARLVVSDLREPDSYEHISTRLSPVDESGNHQLVMRYRARNGFGGMGIGTIEATVKNADCSFAISDMQTR